MNCHSMNLSVLPHTIIVHGEGDKVIRPPNADLYVKALPKSELILWKNCGHAPHLHNPDALRGLIARHV